jgi:putative membrane protein
MERSVFMILKMMEGYNHGMGFFGMGWGWLLILIIIGLIVWLVIKLTNQSPDNSEKKEETVLDILNKRYARGEIDKQEYEEKKKDLI